MFLLHHTLKVGYFAVAKLLMRYCHLNFKASPWSVKIIES